MGIVVKLHRVRVKDQLDEYFAVARLLALLWTVTEREKSGSISLRMDQFFILYNWPQKSENKSQRLTGCVLWHDVCIRSSGQWSLFSRQHPSSDGPVFWAGTSPRWWARI